MASRAVEKRFVLDAGVRFSGSCLWDLMSSYYDTQGAKAWARRGEIPSYITSNAFIAAQYADIIAAYVRDVTVCPEEGVDLAEPFYVVEVGSGHGKFTFLLLERLRELWGAGGPMAKIGAEGAHICVVCTDIAKSNVVAIRDRPELQQFRGGREGAGSISLDFAIYDANADQSITLLDKGVTLSPSAPSTNPILVIANYVFDSLKYDVYRFSSDGCLQEGLVSTWSDLPPENAKVLSHFECAFKYEDIDADERICVYGDECGGALDAILGAYRRIYMSLPPRKRCDGLSFNIPVGALRCLWVLRALSRSGGLVCLTGDKGNIDASEFIGSRAPAMASHGCFSMMVNFHAIDLFFQYLDGFSYVSPYRCSSLKVAASCIPAGDKPSRSLHKAAVQSKRKQRHRGSNPLANEKEVSASSRFVNLRWMADRTFSSFGPNEFSELSEALRWDCHPLPLSGIAALISLSKHDVDLMEDYRRVYKRVHRCAPPRARGALLASTKRLFEHDYALSSADDVAFLLGCICQRGKAYPEACSFFLRSLQRQPRDKVHVTHCNLGICYFKLGDFRMAVEHLQRALEAEPDYDKAKLWMTKAQQARVMLPEKEQTHLAAMAAPHSLATDGIGARKHGREQAVDAVSLEDTEPSSPLTSSLAGIEKVRQSSLAVLEASRQRRLARSEALRARAALP